MDLHHTRWQERQIEGGGIKWQLLDVGEDEMVVLATVVRLPGTLVRVYWPDGRMDDHASPHEARTSVEAALAAKPQFTVVGHTPGYLSEDDDPPTFDSYEEAVAHMNSEAKRYEDGDYGDSYRVEYGWASAQNYAAVMVWDDSKTHDLGFVIEVLQMEAD